MFLQFKINRKGNEALFLSCALFNPFYNHIVASSPPIRVFPSDFLPPRFPPSVSKTTSTPQAVHFHLCVIDPTESPSLNHLSNPRWPMKPQQSNELRRVFLSWSSTICWSFGNRSLQLYGLGLSTPSPPKASLLLSKDDKRTGLLQQ